MEKKIIIVATLFGLLSILLDVFEAHTLKKILSINQLNSFGTGVRYQLYHAFFLLFIGVYDGITEKMKKIIFILIVLGVVFFSGSIYLLTTTAITSIDISAFALVTPVGGVLLIAAWSVLFINVLTSPK